MTTREVLLLTAGQLFAERGFDGVSTRAIAEEAGVKLGSIHYHFGSKENLYLEVFKYAKDNGRSTGFKDVILENPGLVESPVGQAEVIKNTIHRRFYDYFRSDRPVWETQVLIREITNPSSASVVLSEKLFQPDNEGAVQFYFIVKPNAKKDEAEAWAYMLYSQILLYITAKNTLESARGGRPLDAPFYHASARVLAKAMILAIDLPLPEDLK